MSNQIRPELVSIRRLARSLILRCILDISGLGLAWLGIGIWTMLTEDFFKAFAVFVTVGIVYVVPIVSNVQIVRKVRADMRSIAILERHANQWDILVGQLTSVRYLMRVHERLESYPRSGFAGVFHTLYDVLRRRFISAPAPQERTRGLMSLVIQCVRWAIPIQVREPLLHDLAEQAEEMRSAGKSEWRIRGQFLVDLWPAWERIAKLASSVILLGGIVAKLLGII